MRLLFGIAAAAALSTQVPATELPLVPPTLRARWVEDMRSKNLNDILRLYAPGAVFISPDGTTVSGADDLQKLYETVFTAFDSDITLNPPHHRDLGPPRQTTGIIDDGTYRETLRTLSTRVTQNLCGRYIFTYSKATDGSSGWRIARMEWTSDPCPAPDATKP